MKKSIFITGGSSGIGKATAILFANKGWFVGIADVNEAGLTELKKYRAGESVFPHVWMSQMRKWFLPCCLILTVLPAGRLIYYSIAQGYIALIRLKISL